ncbi:MAG: sucrase ferredoxin [Anaerolineae bacterium]|nr:sucrase ferredoxin [Anaerolineae bacterium]
MLQNWTEECTNYRKLRDEIQGGLATMSAENIPTKAYCNCLALKCGLDPIGHAGNFQDALIVEVPLPWKSDMFYDEKVLPSEIRNLLALWLQQYRETGVYPHRPLTIAPDKEYTLDGYRRVMLYTRPAAPFTAFEKVEYLVPVEKLGILVWSLFEDRAALPQFDSYRVPDADHVRDILVCTHGTIDVACAKFGYPLYKHLRDTYSSEHLRVWRVSHFGGHVFAPTLMDMPIGHYWAYVGKEQAVQIIQREGNVAALRGHYRGWAGLDDGFQQTAECDLWQRYGWDWFGYPRMGETLVQDEDNIDSQWADVCLRWKLPDESEMAEKLRVDVAHMVETPSSTDGESTYPYSQYRVRQTRGL